jgi:hypothetical protein
MSGNANSQLKWVVDYGPSYSIRPDDKSYLILRPNTLSIGYEHGFQL